MDDEILGGIIFIIIAILIIIGLIQIDKNYNTKNHSEDIEITEWISPDGVHYWYQRSGYRAMLAPRYDSEGNLVIDEQE